VTSAAVLERISIVTPLGVRLRDESTRGYVTEALSVVVYPTLQPELRTNGVLNSGTVFVFRNLPGLREIEQGDGDDVFWSAQTPPQFDFVLEVRDAAGRYLPFLMPIKLPQRRILSLDLTSPPASPLVLQSGHEEGYLPLFPSPSGFVPDGMGSMYAELVDALTMNPAAWAVVEAKAGEQRLVTGVADRQGRLLLPLFYPKPVIILGSPGSVNTPLTQQSWAVDMTVRYRPRDPVPEIPDLVDILTQPLASAWIETSPPAEWTKGTLRFGRELAPEDQMGNVMPRLLITPAGTPP
jgi:hypothetical protein